MREEVPLEGPPRSGEHRRLTLGCRTGKDLQIIANEAMECTGDFHHRFLEGWEELGRAGDDQGIPSPGTVSAILKETLDLRDNPRTSPDVFMGCQRILIVTPRSPSSAWAISTPARIILGKEAVQRSAQSESDGDAAAEREKPSKNATKRGAGSKGTTVIRDSYAPFLFEKRAAGLPLAEISPGAVHDARQPPLLAQS